MHMFNRSLPKWCNFPMLQEAPLAIGLTSDSLSRQCRRCLGVTDSTGSSAVRCDRSDMQVHLLRGSCSFVSRHHQPVALKFAGSACWNSEHVSYLQVLCRAILQQVLRRGGPDCSCGQWGVPAPPEPSGQVGCAPAVQAYLHSIISLGPLSAVVIPDCQSGGVAV